MCLAWTKGCSDDVLLGDPMIERVVYDEGRNIVPNSVISRNEQIRDREDGRGEVRFPLSSSRSLLLCTLNFVKLGHRRKRHLARCLVSWPSEV